MVWTIKRPILRNSAKFHEDQSIHCCDIAIFVIFKIAVAAILDLSGTYWDHPRSLFGGLYCCANLGWNRCSTFDNMKVSTFCAFCLKTPIHAPKIGVFGGFDSLIREQY